MRTLSTDVPRVPRMSCYLNLAKCSDNPAQKLQKKSGPTAGSPPKANRPLRSSATGEMEKMIIPLDGVRVRELQESPVTNHDSLLLAAITPAIQQINSCKADISTCR